MAEGDASSPDKKREEPPPLEFLKPGETQTPPPAEQGPVAWVTRPEDFQRPAYPVGPAPPRQPSSGWKGLVAGILLLLAGGFGIAAVIVSSLTPLSPAVYANLTNDTTAYATNQICSLIIIWSQTAAILGGVMALQRLNWKLTLVCAIFATLTVGFFLEASFMGMAGFILVVLARNEFRS